jgi:hypothetical protein
LTAWRLNILQLFHRKISDSLVGLGFQAHEAVIADGTPNPQESFLILEMLFQPESFELALNAVGRSLRFRGLDVEGSVVANVFVGDSLCLVLELCSLPSSLYCGEDGIDVILRSGRKWRTPS